MSASTLFLVCFCLVAAISARGTIHKAFQLNVLDFREEFEAWKLTHNKLYGTQEEHETRFQNFVVRIKCERA